MSHKKSYKKDMYINRELSWLAFNERVLAQSQRNTTPLLERLRFIAISGKNLDEFYMVRVAGLCNQMAAGIRQSSDNYEDLSSLLEEIHERSSRLMHTQQTQLRQLEEELAKERIEIIRDPDSLSRNDKKWLKSYFHNNIFPILTPLAIDPAHPFPFIPNLALAIAVELIGKKSKTLKALIPVPTQIRRFHRLPGKTYRYMTTEAIILMFMEELFPNFTIESQGCIRVLRDSEIEMHDESEDFVRYFENSLKKRKRGAVILLMVEKTMPRQLLDFVKGGLELEIGEVIAIEGILGLADIDQVLNSSHQDLKYPVYTERHPERIKEFGGSCLRAIRQKDIIVHHPFESFDVVVQFLHEAARDPNVVSIKQTLYRTSNESPIVEALIEAAENGKSVTAVVEIKARFDELANLKWAQDMERAGIVILYGLLGLKTHAKISVVTRKEEGGLKTYCHFGTGNYHPVTAKTYVDLSLFTADPQMGQDALKIFNYITGYATPEKMAKLSYSPHTLKPTLLKDIRKEMENAKVGLPAAIWLKVNSIVDKSIINALYKASQAGVQIDMIVRGICCLRPGVPGISDNIGVKSIVGRFLEHGRIFCFANGQPIPSNETKVYISSADLMPRNLDWRVETLIPIENETVKAQVVEQIMLAYMRDTFNSWHLLEDGIYQHARPDKKPFNAHRYFLENPSLSGQGQLRKKQRTTIKE